MLGQNAIIIVEWLSICCYRHYVGETVQKTFEMERFVFWGKFVTLP